MPPGGGRAAGGLGGVLAAAGLGIYTLSNCLFNVEGGHRAIVFNRVVGIKENVSSSSLSLSLSLCLSLSLSLFSFSHSLSLFPSSLSSFFRNETKVIIHITKVRFCFFFIFCCNFVFSFWFFNSYFS